MLALALTCIHQRCADFCKRLRRTCQVSPSSLTFSHLARISLLARKKSTHRMASSHPPSCYDDAAGDDDDVDFSQEEGPKAPARPAYQKEACTFIIVVHASILLLVQLPIRLFVRRVPLSLSLSLSLSLILSPSLHLTYHMKLGFAAFCINASNQRLPTEYLNEFQNSKSQTRRPRRTKRAIRKLSRQGPRRRGAATAAAATTTTRLRARSAVVLVRPMRVERAQYPARFVTRS